jgi:hypothetical protein
MMTCKPYGDRRTVIRVYFSAAICAGKRTPTKAHFESSFTMMTTVKIANYFAANVIANTPTTKISAFIGNELASKESSG